MKRMTLLAKRPDLSSSDFRQYWAGPHGSLALEMEGISRYTQNRVEKILWARNGVPSFSVDGIVELWFEGEDAMRRAQGSSIGRDHIPSDELNFLKGWTLCLVDEVGSQQKGHTVKVMLPFLMNPGVDQATLQARISEVAKKIGVNGDSTVSFNWTTSHARRERLWAEPVPPTGFAVFWLRSLKDAHDCFARDGAIAATLTELLDDGVAYLVQPLELR